jgi:hypothetical protein
MMKSLMSLLLLSVTVVGVCSSSSIDIDETMTVGGTERGAAVVGAAGAGTVEEEVMHGVVGLGMTGESQCSYFKNILVSSLFVFRCIYIHSLNTLTSCHSKTPNTETTNDMEAKVGRREAKADKSEPPTSSPTTIQQQLLQMQPRPIDIHPGLLRPKNKNKYGN